MYRVIMCESFLARQNILYVVDPDRELIFERISSCNCSRMAPIMDLRISVTVIVVM